jgi:hypothetical protein
MFALNDQQRVIEKSSIRVLNCRSTGFVQAVLRPKAQALDPRVHIQPYAHFQGVAYIQGLAQDQRRARV